MLTFIFNKKPGTLPSCVAGVGLVLACSLETGAVSAQPAPTDAPPSAAVATANAPPATDAPGAATQQPRPATPAAAPPAAAPATGPVVSLPEALPEPNEATNASPATAVAPVPAAMGDVPVLRAGHTSVGGYAELHLNVAHVTGPGARDAQIDLHRFVLFLAHDFNERLRFYSELEVEHAVASSTDPGEVEVEQAYVDYRAIGDQLGVRAGLVLVPMGIINQWHEPPMFHGVERPMVDTLIIPTTWREAAVGVFGEPLPGLRYQLYLMTALNASGFSVGQGLREGMGETALARANGAALSARIEYEPVLGVLAGLSGYYGKAGPNADLRDSGGTPLHLGVPVAGVAADIRARSHGVEARAELAYFHVGNTAALRAAADSDGKSLGLDVGAALLGYYGELAYDVLYSARIEPALLPFVRLERYDTLASVVGRARTAADAKAAATDVVVGLTFRPVSQVAFKADYRWSNPDGADASGHSDATGQADFGLGVMF